MSVFFWKGGRVVEGARLERVYGGNLIVGSNPTLSAKKIGTCAILAVGLLFS